MSDGHYDRPALSWMFIALLMIWSGVAGSLLAFGYRSRVKIVVAEQVITMVLMWSTRLCVPPDFYHAHQTLPTTIWVANAVASAALLWGPWVGMTSGLVMGLGSMVVRGGLTHIADVPTVPVLMTVGLAVGAVSTTVRHARDQIDAAVRMQAATAERERLAREVHDGVLQVLAFVQRRGNEIGGETAELARLAGEQERELRTLVSRQAVTPRRGDGAQVDLQQQLRARIPSEVELSAPGDPVLLPGASVDELTSVVLTVLDNAARHAGPGARVFILIEDLGGEVVLTVRDDGIGIPEGRLAEAEAEGRMGVSESIRGRVETLGGTAALRTGPGEGTEWELQIPRGMP
ncbi:ATP-binding protein [Leekyejoonella antrihumi]|uniref:ATP-binding protein n=2 Tax=Leekyejoonella antrihumi TaxID=1660198 RepID=A0A563E994_9MICO|nr:ATP-binding protein [Leekyejoonella antrihumi]